MPNSSIRFAPGFMSLSKVSDTVYCQCFVGQGVHASYAQALQQEAARICLWSGVPALQSQLVANNVVFVITSMRYMAYQEAVLIQFGLSVLPTAALAQNKLLDESVAILPILESTPDTTRTPFEEREKA